MWPSLNFMCVVVSVFFARSVPVFSIESDIAEMDTLRLVQVIFRHGDRAPTNSYPNDPNLNNPAAWPEGMAQLTSLGKMQQFQLGKYLRQRYNGFLAKRYKSDEVYVVSSDMDRTIMSLESNLAGLFPPVRKWLPSLDWQPIPLRTIPWKEDRYLHVNVHCPRYEKIYHDFLRNSDVVLKINQDNKDFVHFLSEQTGVRASTVKDIIHIQDIILTEMIHNLSVPTWAMEALPRLNRLQAELNTWSTYTDEMKRLKGGPLLELLTKNMLANTGGLGISVEDKRVVVGGGNRKILMYSAHDSTLTRIMNTLGIFSPHNPPYAAALMLELHWSSEDKRHFVKILYRNETGRVPYEMELPGCGSPCPLDRMMTLTQHLIPQDWTEECRTEDSNDFLYAPSPFYPPYLGILGISLFLACLLLLFFYIRLNEWARMRGDQKRDQLCLKSSNYQTI